MPCAIAGLEYSSTLQKERFSTSTHEKVSIETINDIILKIDNNSSIRNKKKHAPKIK